MAGPIRTQEEWYVFWKTIWVSQGLLSAEQSGTGAGVRKEHDLLDEPDLLL